jgi:hypothetical protein
MAQKFLKPDDTQLAEYRETLATCKAVLAGRAVDGSGGAVPAKPDEKRGGG